MFTFCLPISDVFDIDKAAKRNGRNFRYEPLGTVSDKHCTIHQFDRWDRRYGITTRFAVKSISRTYCDALDMARAGDPRNPLNWFRHDSFCSADQEWIGERRDQECCDSRHCIVLAGMM